jgi:lipid-A-disaccharide synthase-like uncharacterized protein
MSQTTIFELLGIAGISIGVIAYVPQVVHLAREHCSAGVSGRAWAMWLTSSLLIGALALHRHDPVFIALQASSLTSTAMIVFLTHRYRGMVCEAHAHLRPTEPRPPSRAGDRDDVIPTPTRPGSDAPGIAGERFGREAQEIVPAAEAVVGSTR